MPSEFIAPYVVSHVFAVLFVVLAWRRPGIARIIAGFGFLLAGIFNLRTALTTPHVYVDGFGPHALWFYRTFIYGSFARHTLLFVGAIACGQLAIGILSFTPDLWRRLGYIGAILFLVAITPLGLCATAPSTLIFAAGFLILWGRNLAPTHVKALPRPQSPDSNPSDKQPNLLVQRLNLDFEPRQPSRAINSEYDDRAGGDLVGGPATQLRVGSSSCDVQS
ncbi:MAG TPA: hypothetical protein VMX38_10995 [Verrucomicrobiae bacterium]|nr:hypothetical protein [Verrucomicrobiae bacterium]